MFTWMKDIIDGIRWARCKMLSEREDNALVAKVSFFLSAKVLPEVLRFEAVHGHRPTNLSLSMNLLTEFYRMVDLRESPPPQNKERLCLWNKMVVIWNGEETGESWELVDKPPDEQQIDLWQLILPKSHFSH